MRTESVVPVKPNFPCTTSVESRSFSSLFLTVLRYIIRLSSPEISEDPSMLYDLTHEVIDISTDITVKNERYLFMILGHKNELADKNNIKSRCEKKNSLKLSF